MSCSSPAMKASPSTPAPAARDNCCAAQPTARLCRRKRSGSKALPLRPGVSLSRQPAAAMPRMAVSPSSATARSSVPTLPDSR